jgi:hypothetical protein
MAVQDTCYHIFYFPFKWKIKNRKYVSYSEKYDLRNLSVQKYSYWKEIKDITDVDKIDLDGLYKEKGFYFPSVHPILYATKGVNSILRHFEREEPPQGGVSYIVNQHQLHTTAIDINLYATGVGTLIFYLKNSRYTGRVEIREINEKGSLVFPNICADNSNISISIEGLNGFPLNYQEKYLQYESKDNPWEKPARFIKTLINDLCSEMEISALIGNKMFVSCFHKETLYFCRLNIPPVSVEEQDVRTVYARMIELVLVQRASTLCFSEEIANVTQFTREHKKHKDIDKRINSLYREYLRFINQIYFKEITSDKMGQKIYKELFNKLHIKDYAKELEIEMDKLYQYDKGINTKRLNILIVILTLVTIIIGVIQIILPK